MQLVKGYEKKVYVTEVLFERIVNRPGFEKADKLTQALFGKELHQLLFVEFSGKRHIVIYEGIPMYGFWEGCKNKAIVSYNGKSIL
jgi:hypothetical protein